MVDMREDGAAVGYLCLVDRVGERLPGTNFIADATRAALYDQIKTMPDFTGATDA